MCAGNAVFYDTEVLSESKTVRETLRFTIETAVGGCEGTRCETAGATKGLAWLIWSFVWVNLVFLKSYWMLF